MTASDLLSDLRARGVELVAAGDRIRFRPADALTDADRAALRDHRAEIIVLLAGDFAPVGDLATGDWVHLIGRDGATHNVEPWRVDAIVSDAGGLLAVFIGRPYASWPLAYCRRAASAAPAETERKAS